MTDGLIDSAFIVKLREAFNSPAAANLWDGSFADDDVPGKMQLIANDIAAAFKALFMRCEKDESPATPTTVNSAEKIVADFLRDTTWIEDPQFPVPGNWDPVAFRRYEVAAAMYIIMQAYNRSGPGGGPASLPPSH